MRLPLSSWVSIWREISVQRTWWISSRKFKTSTGKIRGKSLMWRCNNFPPYSDIVIAEGRSCSLMSMKDMRRIGGSILKKTVKLQVIFWENNLVYDKYFYTFSVWQSIENERKVSASTFKSSNSYWSLVKSLQLSL